MGDTPEPWAGDPLEGGTQEHDLHSHIQPTDVDTKPEQQKEFLEEYQKQADQHVTGVDSLINGHEQTDAEYLQGLPHHHMTPSELAAVHQHHQVLLLQAHHEAQAQAARAHQNFADTEPSKRAALDLEEAASLQLHTQHNAEVPGQEGEFEKERKEKRKVANREAARRMRQRRAEQLSNLSVSNSDMKAENVALQQQLGHLATHNRELMTENAALKQDLLNIKQALESGRLTENPNIDLPAQAPPGQTQLLH